MVLFKNLKSIVVVIFGIVLLHVNSTFGQATQLKKIVMPSPNVMAIQKYGDIPVSTYNGIPDISIPLYTIKSHDITVPITLSYHASGIKVNEPVSQVGLGWVLNAGGVISRSIIGYDDFLMGRYFNDSHSSYRSNMADFDKGVGPAFSWMDFYHHAPNYPVCIVPIFNKNQGQQTIQNTDLSAPLASSVLAEYQPDQFYYNVQGLSGKFILQRDKLAVLQKQDKIKITCVDEAGGSFTIAALDGTVYTFDQLETNHSTRMDEPIDKMTTAWYLSNITSPTGNQVKFYYKSLPDQVQPASSYSESVETFKTVPGMENTAIITTNIPPVHKEVYSNTYTILILDYIDYDNGRVLFNYSNQRDDVPGDKRLESLSVFTKNNQGVVNTLPVKKDSLIYSYFNSANNTNVYNSSYGGNPLKRLKLTGVVENGYYLGKIQPGSPYKFAYFEGDVHNNLPPKTSFAVDHWGYYNGRNQNTSFIPSFVNMHGASIYDYYAGIPGPEREPDTSYMRAFTLRNITYPTGGSTDFQYEAHDYDESKSITNDNSGYVKQTAIVTQTANFTYYADTHKVIGSGTLDMSNEFKDSNGNIVPGKLNCSFRLSGGQGPIPSLLQNIMYISVLNPDGSEAIRIDPANYTSTPSFPGGPYVTYSAASSIIIVNNIPLNLNPAVYTWTAYNSSSNYGKYLMDMHSIFYWSALVNYDLSNSNSTTPANYLAGGGLRIKRIIDHDAINSLNDKVKKFDYHYIANGSNGQPQEFSYGLRMSKPQYSFWLPSRIFYQDDTDGQCHVTGIYDVVHLMRSAESNISLSGSGAGSAVAYNSVTVLNGENGENGKSVYQYVNEPDYVEGYTNLFLVQERPPYNSNVANGSNGSLLNETDYVNANGNFNKIRELNNFYSTTDILTNEVFGMERREVQYDYFLDGAPSSNICAGGLAPCTNLELFGYRTLVSKFTFLFTSEERQYDENDPTKFISDLTYYFHDNPAHLLTTRTVKVNSKGEKVTSNVTYPLDYITPNSSKHISQSIEALKAKNIVVAPIESYTSITNPDNTNTRVTSAYLMSYNQNTAFPDTVFQLQSVTPLTTFAKLKDTTYVKNANYKPVVVFDNYDGHGNIIQQHKVDDVNHSYMWAYNGSFPIAEAIGTANVNSIAYTSFETADQNGFLYYGSTTFDPTSPTGQYCYNLGGGAVNNSYGINSTTTYIVSYWTKNTVAYTIAGTIAGYPKQGKTVNGWTYFEHKISGQSSINISGSGFIDEIRLYPDGSLMTTYAFSPAAGMTESMDVKGQVNHFEYDGLMRLQNIKDQSGNILKNYAYNYYSLTVPNTAIYNRAYTRNNCPANTTPGAPIYVSIPGGKYYGYDQPSADAAAQADLDYNAQNNANANCSCTTTSVTFTLTNSTGVSGFQAYFSGLTSYAFPASGTTTITVPAGTYNITINPINAPTTRKFTLSSSSTGGSTVVTAPGTTFSNIAVNTGVNNVVTIQVP